MNTNQSTDSGLTLSQRLAFTIIKIKTRVPYSFEILAEKKDERQCEKQFAQ
jgi:hypothetical protein